MTRFNGYGDYMIGCLDKNASTIISHLLLFWFCPIVLNIDLGMDLFWLLMWSWNAIVFFPSVISDQIEKEVQGVKVHQCIIYMDTSHLPSRVVLTISHPSSLEITHSPWWSQPCDHVPTVTSDRGGVVHHHPALCPPPAFFNQSCFDHPRVQTLRRSLSLYINWPLHSTFSTQHNHALIFISDQPTRVKAFISRPRRMASLQTLQLLLVSSVTNLLWKTF